MTVALNMAMTLDGKVMLPDGRWHGISSAHDRRRMDEIRLEFDAIVAGKNSLLRDDPNFIPRAVPAGSASPRPVLLARGELYPLELRVFNQSERRPLVLVNQELFDKPRFASYPGAGGARSLATMSVIPGEQGAADYFVELERRARVLAVAADDFEPSRLFALLGKEGLARVLLETGPAFNHGVFAADLLDVLYLTLTPFVIGGSDLPGIVHGATAFVDFARREWHLKACERIEQEVFLRYERPRAPA